MELTTDQKIEAWTKMKKCLESRNKWFSMCGINTDLLCSDIFNGKEYIYIKNKIRLDMYVRGNYLFQLMFPVDDKDSRIKYINNKIKQLENEK